MLATSSYAAAASSSLERMKKNFNFEFSSILNRT